MYLNLSNSNSAINMFILFNNISVVSFIVNNLPIYTILNYSIIIYPLLYSFLNIS